MDAAVLPLRLLDAGGYLEKKSIHGGSEQEVFFVKLVHTFGSKIDDQDLRFNMCIIFFSL
jgi:hypothetical protein